VIVILKPCRKAIEALSEEIRGDLADALARLDVGMTLSLPLSRPKPAIGRGVHELRLRDRSGGIGWWTHWALAARSMCFMLSTRPRRRHRSGTRSWRERG
jgi:hypothetical protein